jgi:hypothetical protein
MAGLRFSRRTVIAAVDVMEGSIKTHDDLTRCFLKLDQDLAARCGDGTLSNRFNHLIKFTDEDRGNMVEDGTLLQDALVSEAVKRLRPMRAVIPWKKAEPLPSNPDDEAFLRFLELDGFSVTNGILRHTLPADMELPATKDEMTRLLDKHNFPVAKGHLEQALDAHARGDWASGQRANPDVHRRPSGRDHREAGRLDHHLGQRPAASGEASSDWIPKARSERMG